MLDLIDKLSGVAAQEVLARLSEGLIDADQDDLVAGVKAEIQRVFLGEGRRNPPIEGGGVQ